MLTQRWAETPLQVRIIVGAAIAVFSYGTVVHLVQLSGGGTDPYPWAPRWLAVYFVSPTVLDPLSAALHTLRRCAGLTLGCIVLVTDAAGNAYATYVLDQAAGRAGQGIIALLAAALVLTASRVRPWLNPSRAAP